MRRSTHGDYDVLLAGHWRHVGDRRGARANRQGVLPEEFAILRIVGTDVVILEASKSKNSVPHGGGLRRSYRSVARDIGSLGEPKGAVSCRVRNYRGFSP